MSIELLSMIGGVVPIIILYGVIITLVRAAKARQNQAGTDVYRKPAENQTLVQQQRNQPYGSYSNPTRSKNANTFGMGREHDSLATVRKRQDGIGGTLKIGERQEIDCGLDERIFGSKHQHKDIF